MAAHEAAGVELEPRYRVMFTPVGWQVVDGFVACDPLAEYGTGPAEYRRAVAARDELEGRRVEHVEAMALAIEAWPVLGERLHDDDLAELERWRAARHNT